MLTFPVLKLGMCEDENSYPIDSSIVRKITKRKNLFRMRHWSCPNVTGSEQVCRIVPIARDQITRSFYPACRQTLATARPVNDFVGGTRLAQELIGNPSLASLPLQFSD
jgi:hypothetical protein